MRIETIVISALAGLSLSSAVSAQSAPETGAYRIVRSYSAGDAFWDYGTFDEKAGRLYLGRENGVTTIDVGSGKVTERFVEGQQVHGVVLLDGNRVMASNGASANAMIFDRDTGKVEARIPTGEKPDGAAIEPVTGTLLIMDSIGHDVVFANPGTAQVLGRIALDGEPGTPVPDGKGNVFAGVTDHSEIVMIDVAARKIVKTLALPDCADSGGLALDPETGVLLVTCANLKALTVDARSGQILGSVAIDKYPDAILFDPKRKVFYVPTILPGNLFVVAEDKSGAPIVKAKVALAPGVHTAALDAASGLLYVPAGQIHLVHGQRPTVEPGTFKVLVVDVNH
jgi:DNA-binding beta-propeller fold protein YncE